MITIENKSAPLFALGQIGKDLAKIIHVLFFGVVVDFCVDTKQQVHLFFNLLKDFLSKGIHYWQCFEF